jgi:soluble cytochrome b562
MHFRFKHLGTVCVLAFALSGTTLGAQDEPKTPLAKKMVAINTAFKVVGRQIEDASKNASTLEQLAIIETNAKAALTLEPEKKGQMPAAAQAKFVTDYQAEMKEFVAIVAKLRTTLKAGNNAEATALVDSLKAQQRDAHKEFRIKKAGAPPAL